MKTEWDHTELAEAYLKRPDYAQEAIDKMLNIAGIKKGDNVCDVGAGAAHLTLKLAEFGLNVCAVEPNDAMRVNGIRRTSLFETVHWFEGVGEHTGMGENKFDLINAEIRKVVEAKGTEHVKVPYTTRIWMAQVK